MNVSPRQPILDAFRVKNMPANCRDDVIAFQQLRADWANDIHGKINLFKRGNQKLQSFKQFRVQPDE